MLRKPVYSEVGYNAQVGCGVYSVSKGMCKENIPIIP